MCKGNQRKYCEYYMERRGRLPESRRTPIGVKPASMRAKEIAIKLGTPDFNESKLSTRQRNLFGKLLANAMNAASSLSLVREN